jgi:serine/threonine protein phosphatase PrpC
MVVLGSDGVFDNLFDQDIMDCFMNKVTRENLDVKVPHEITECIANKAEKLSYDKEYMSPFCLNAKKMAGRNMKGGKDDDITVIVG